MYYEERWLTCRCTMPRCHCAIQQVYGGCGSEWSAAKILWSSAEITEKLQLLMHSFYYPTTHQLLPSYEAGRNLEQSLRCHSLVTTTAARFQEDDHHCLHHDLPTLLISLWKWRREAGVHIVTQAKLLSILTGNVTTVISISAILVICAQTASSNIINQLCNLSILSVFSYLCIQLCIVLHMLLAVIPQQPT